jgi:hypothetical protein
MVNGQKNEIPAMFAALSKTRESLLSHWHVAFDVTNDDWDYTREEVPAILQVGAWQEKSTSILARWSSAYEAYLEIRGHRLTNAKKKGLAALRILKELGSTAILLTEMTFDDEMKWDMFYSVFQNVVSLAEDIVELDLSSTVEKPRFCLEMAIVQPLFKVSLRLSDCFPF